MLVAMQKPFTLEQFLCFSAEVGLGRGEHASLGNWLTLASWSCHSIWSTGARLGDFCTAGVCCGERTVVTLLGNWRACVNICNVLLAGKASHKPD